MLFIIYFLFYFVSRLEDHFNIFTLHGHCGPVTTAFVDPGHPLIGHEGAGSGSAAGQSAGSGSQDGMVCKNSLCIKIA